MVENLDLNEIAEEFNKEVITVVMESMVKKSQEISEGIQLSPKKWSNQKSRGTF